MSTITALPAWKRWIYVEWNRKLAQYFLAPRAPGDREIPVERIAATPEELARVAEVDPACAPSLLDAFISCIRRELKPGQGFCDYCLGILWDEDDFPPFFAMLWFTCLVAYGYPEGDGSFSDRLAKALGKSENFHAPGADSPCLPSLWESVARWTEARHRDGVNVRRLNLPSDVGRRTTIGYSHFLAFPNRFDRAKLARVLHDADLIGAEPPLRLLLDTLLRHRKTFSNEFQEDLDDFARQYRTGGNDPRDNAFWRAVRQEAISPSVSADGEAVGQASLAFIADDDGLLPILACHPDYAPPEGYSVESFDDGLSGARLVGPVDDRELPSREAIASARFLGYRDRRLLRSGVIPLRENNAGVFVATSGEDVQGCRSAFVKDAIVAEFTRLFGGVARSSIVAGWVEVHDCDIVQLQELPPWLAEATSLLPTTELPSIQIVGGIPLSDGFLYANSFLPRMRAPGVAGLEVRIPGGEQVPCIYCTDTNEWQLPTVVTQPGDYQILAHWSVATNSGSVTRTRTTALRLRTNAITNDYKGLPSGEFFQESCSQHGESALYSPDEPVLTATTTDPTRSTDTVEFDVTARFLGPGVGEMSLTRQDGFDWLVVGTKKDPECVLFVGDPDHPTEPRAARSPSSGDRRHWHKAWQVPESRRVFRTSAGAVDWAHAPGRLRELWLRYRHHSVSDTAAECQATSLDTLQFAPFSHDIPDPRVDTVVDAIAALGVERRGLSYRQLADVFAQLLRQQDLSLIRQLIRAWTEAGLIDEVRHAVSGRTMFLPRRPRFILLRRATEVDATLVGLVPPVTRRHVVDSAARLGLSIHELGPTNIWQPLILRVRGSENQIEELRKQMHFELSLWLEWPVRDEVPAALDPRIALHSLFDTTPPNSFTHDATWNWTECTFARGVPEPATGVQLSRRMNVNQQRIYVVLSDAASACWTFQRSWALLAAYELKGTPPFVADKPTGQLKSTGRSPVHLPLPIARLCVLIGDGACGPSTTSGRPEYVYPFGPRLFRVIQQVVPPAWFSV